MAQFGKELHKINYKKAARSASPIVGSKAGPISLEDNQWLPASVISFLFNCSRQTIRLLYLSNQIRGLSYPGSPLLFNLSDMRKIYNKSK